MILRPLHTCVLRMRKSRKKIFSLSLGCISLATTTLVIFFESSYCETLLLPWAAQRLQHFKCRLHAQEKTRWAHAAPMLLAHRKTMCKKKKRRLSLPPQNSATGASTKTARASMWHVRTPKFHDPKCSFASFFYEIPPPPAI